MKNEKKANEIAVQMFEDGHFTHNGISQRKEVENALVKMAEWKDKCFDEVIAGLRETWQLDEQVLFVLSMVESRYNGKKQ